MVSVNSVVIGGNLTRDPDLKYLPSGTAVCDLNVAVNRKWTDKASGEKKEAVSFIGVVAFGRTGELAAEYLKKGSPVLIEGEITQDRWDDKASGQKREKTKVTASKVHFIGGKLENPTDEPLVVAETPAKPTPDSKDGGL